MQAVAMPDWRVRLPEHHEGYITLEEFLKNTERLEKNRTNGEETILSGPAREGLALLQGLLLCGHCGRALTVRYSGNGGVYPLYLCNWLNHQTLATKACLSFRCDVLDPVIVEEVLKALQPAELELALAALQELETRDQAILRQWQMRLERAEYEAALAEQISRSRSFAASGGQHIGTSLERCPPSVAGPQEASRGSSAPRSSRGHARAEGESAGSRSRENRLSG